MGDEKPRDCPSDPHRLDPLAGDWVPVDKKQYVLIEWTTVGPGAEGDVTLALKGDFAKHAFQSHRLHCFESVPGAFMILSQTVGGRPQHVLSGETPAVVVSMVALPMHLCKPGEAIVIRVRNTGPVAGEIRMGLVGDMWRPREPADDAKKQRGARKRKGNLGTDET